MNLVLGLKSKHCFYFEDKIQDQVSFEGFPATCWTHPYGLYCECAYSSTTTLTLSLSFQTWKSPLQKQGAQLPFAHTPPASVAFLPPSVSTLGLYLPHLIDPLRSVLWGLSLY